MKAVRLNYTNIAGSGSLRILFALSQLLFFPRWSNISLGSLPSSLYFPPVGPFALLSQYPPTWLIIVIEVVTWISLLAMLLGFETKKFSYAYALTFTLSSGFQYSTGKIDHDIIIPIFVALFASCWGNDPAIKPEVSHPERFARRLRYFGIVLGSFFLSSGLVKVGSGWGHSEISPIYDWLSFYVLNYGLSPFWGVNELSSGVLGSWISIGAVATELIVGCLLVVGKGVRQAVFLALIFHIGVAYFFKILFFKFAPLYMAFFVLVFEGKAKKFGKYTIPLPTLFFAVLALSALVNFEIIQRSYAIVTGSLLFSVLLAYSILFLDLANQIRLRAVHVGAMTMFLLLPTVIVMACNVELYPTLQGPIFRSGVGGDCKIEVLGSNLGDIAPNSVHFQNLNFLLHSRMGQQSHENVSAVNFDPAGNYKKFIYSSWDCDSAR